MMMMMRRSVETHAYVQLSLRGRFLESQSVFAKAERTLATGGYGGVLPASWLFGMLSRTHS